MNENNDLGESYKIINFKLIDWIYQQFSRKIDFKLN